MPGALSKALAAGVARFLRNPEFQPTFKAGRPLRSKHIASKQFRKSQSLTNSSNNFQISAHSVLSVRTLCTTHATALPLGFVHRQRTVASMHMTL